MAYRPTNDIHENIVHRNTIFDAEGMVSCCTCGYCIEKTEDASLKIMNFKSAEPIINESFIGPIREFSDYMIPSGSFEGYILSPYKLTLSSDSLSLSQEKHADTLVYYPFLKCSGSISGWGTSSFPNTKVTIGGGITHPLKYYGAEFGSSVGSAINGTATFSSNTSSISFAGIGNRVASDKIKYDPQFGSYAYQSYRSGKLNTFDYSNTTIKDTAFSPSFCSKPLPPDGTHSSGCEDYYKWTPYTVKPDGGIIFLDEFPDPGAIERQWWRFYSSSFPVNQNLKFSSDLTWNLTSVLESGPNENFAKAFHYTDLYSVFNYQYYTPNTYNPFLYNQNNFFFDVSETNNLQVYITNSEGTTGFQLRAWVSPGPRTYFPSNPNIPIEPCTDEEIDYIIQMGYGGYYNNLQFPFTGKTPLSRPPDIDIGDYQPYVDYLSSNDFGDLSFKSNSPCTNNIVKMMEPVFYKDFDDYSFSYAYPDFNNIYTDYYITDKILAPNFTRCDVEYNREVNPDPRFPNPYPWVPTYPTAEAKTYKIKSIGDTYQIYKGGYVLDRFEFNKDGSFYATMSIVKESDFFVLSSEKNWFVQYETMTPYVGGVPPFSNIYCSASFNQWVNVFYDLSTSLHYKESFVLSSSFQVQEYEDQLRTGHYVNGLFSNYYLGLPLMYHSDICRGYWGFSPQLSCPTSYVGQKTNRTQIASSTDSSGRTTVLIKNVLWIGKQLLKTTYSTDDGSSNYGKVTSIIPTSIGANYSKSTSVIIGPPTNRSNLPLPVFTAKATPIITNGSITGYNITDSGSGYDPSNPPTVSLSYGTGTGATARAIVSPEPNRLANGIRVPSYYEASLHGGFESDIEISFQSVPICKLKNVPDKLKRVNRIKMKFENYRKIPQTDFIMEGKASILVEATPELSAESVAYYSGFLTSSFTPGVYSVPNNTFDNVAFIEPNVNKDNTVVFYNKIPQSGENPFVKDIVEIDPPVLTSYTSKVGRAYPDFGVPDRFKSCVLVNGDESVWETGNQVKFIGLNFLVTNGGSGYTAVPGVAVSGGGGTGATARATISGGRVISVSLENLGRNYTSNKTLLITGGGGSGATAIDITFTPFYSIYMEEIKDEKQTAGQSLIRIATTLENANNGVYIPNVGLETLYKGKDLEVKFLYKYKDISLENTPGFLNFNPNEADFSNEKASSSGAVYNETGLFATGFTSQLKLQFANNVFNEDQVSPTTFYFDMGNYQFKPYFQMTGFFNERIDPFKYDRTEIVSLSPLKIKYVGVEFIYSNGNSAFANLQKYVVTSYTPPNIPTITTESTHTRSVGFKCDVVLEEYVDEFIQESLPVEFNQILENVQYIQTSNSMNSRKPMQMINPEQCEHIGKVIDRKDCNCPKKWVRECDVHGKTDWKNCMQCKDFKMSE